MASKWIFLVLIIGFYSEGLCAANTEAENVTKEDESGDRLPPLITPLGVPTGTPPSVPDGTEEPVRCYGRWGCLSFGGPFVSIYRPVNLFPFHPDTMKVHFLLFTRKNTDQWQKLRLDDNSSFTDSFFDSSKPIIFIIHGYMEHGNQKWIKDMTNELLSRDNSNVISVDWVFGAAPPYTQAVANARMVGMVLAEFIKHTMNEHDVQPTNIHVIGHSLGAHIAGYAGDETKGLGRITGLDPAEPYFQYTKKEVRLDPSDANFVDVIHTDGGSFIRGEDPSYGSLTSFPDHLLFTPYLQHSVGLGMIQDCGHVDFYPNGGVRQPGCNSGVLPSIEKEGIYNGLRRYIGCNHLRSYELFTASINTECPFYGYVCDSYQNFSRALCDATCGTDKSKCAPIGFRADQWQQFKGSEPVKMFLQTGNTEPFCYHHYVIEVKYSKTATSQKHGEEKGRLFVQLTGTRRHSRVLEADKHVVHFGPGKDTRFLASDLDLGRLLRADVQWKTPSHFFNPLTWRIFDPPTIFIDRVIITNVETGASVIFCGDNEPQPPERIRALFPSEGCPEPAAQTLDGEPLETVTQSAKSGSSTVEAEGP